MMLEMKTRWEWIVAIEGCVYTRLREGRAVDQGLRGRRSLPLGGRRECHAPSAKQAGPPHRLGGEGIRKEVRIQHCSDKQGLWGPSSPSVSVADSSRLTSEFLRVTVNIIRLKWWYLLVTATWSNLVVYTIPSLKKFIQRSVQRNDLSQVARSTDLLFAVGHFLSIYCVQYVLSSVT